MTTPVVYGPRYSTNVRSTLLTLEEKGVAYDVDEVDIFAGQGQEPAHLARHPFGKVPAFEHEGLVLYETCAIMRYIDEAFQGPRLQPGDPRGRARMVQIMSVLDSYTYDPFISQIVIPRLVTPMMGGTPDEAAIEAAIPLARTCVTVLESLVAGEFLAAKTLSLADLHLVPLYDYFRQTPEGEALLAGAPKLNRWWSTMCRRPSVPKTAPSLG